MGEGREKNKPLRHGNLTTEGSRVVFCSCNPLPLVLLHLAKVVVYHVWTAFLSSVKTGGLFCLARLLHVCLCLIWGARPAPPNLLPEECHIPKQNYRFYFLECLPVQMRYSWNVKPQPMKLHSKKNPFTLSKVYIVPVHPK